MGTPVEPGEKGFDCQHSTPIPFPIGQTPKYLMVMFTDIQKCVGAPPAAPDPPNGPWILTQNAVQHCIWQNFTGAWMVTYTIGVNFTRLELRNGGAGNIFHSWVGEPAWAHFVNDLECQPLAWLGHGFGFVDLFDFPGTAYQLLHDYNLAPVDYTKFDVFRCKGEPPYVQVRRFGNVRTPTNIKIKTDATHKDQYEMFEA